MARQERVSRRPAKKAVERPSTVSEVDTQAESGSGHSPDSAVIEAADEFVDGLDELLDELDEEWTEHEAKTFLAQYVQKGGE